MVENQYFCFSLHFQRFLLQKVRNNLIFLIYVKNIAKQCETAGLNRPHITKRPIWSNLLSNFRINFLSSPCTAWNGTLADDLASWRVPLATTLMRCEVLRFLFQHFLLKFAFTFLLQKMATKSHQKKMEVSHCSQMDLLLWGPSGEKISLIAIMVTKWQAASSLCFYRVKIRLKWPFFKFYFG